MSYARVLSAVGVACALTACGGSSTSPSSTPAATSSQPTTSSSCAGNKGQMVARINGAAWTATCVATASFNSGIVSLGATDGVQSIGLSISANGLGDYTMTPLDPNNPPDHLMIASGLVTLIPASAAAWTASSGTPDSSGTLTVTGLSATGVAGTFSFTAVATPGTGATGTKIVTNGGFSVTF